MTIKIVIIIPNENIISLPTFVSQCEQFHIEKIKKFITEIGIELGPEQLKSSQKASQTLAEHDFCVMLYDEIETLKNLVIFLPNKISNNQLNWFQKREEGLKNYTLSVFSYTEEQKWELIDNTTTSEPIISVLNQLLTQRCFSVKNKKEINIKKLMK